MQVSRSCRAGVPGERSQVHIRRGGRERRAFAGERSPRVESARRRSAPSCKRTPRALVVTTLLSVARCRKRATATATWTRISPACRVKPRALLSEKRRASGRVFCAWPPARSCAAVSLVFAERRTGRECGWVCVLRLSDYEQRAAAGAFIDSTRRWNYNRASGARSSSAP